MPLDDAKPIIDNRRYDDIVNELRARIEHYTPEWQPVWTDENHSDPGITLIQLFAWLSDMLLYRLGRVPDLNYVKFLELLGIELRSAEPAAAELTFPVKKDHGEAYVVVASGTQVAAEGESGPLIFETEKVLYALTAILDSVQVDDGYTLRPVGDSNESMNGFKPFGQLVQEDSALMLGFDADMDLPEVELDLAFWVPESENVAGFYDCGLGGSDRVPPARLYWEYWNGREWKPLKLLRDDTLAFTRSGHILLKLPAAGKVVKDAPGGLSENRYWLRARLGRNSYETAPRILGLRTNTVPARQAETVREEVLGGSNGRPNQVVRLGNTPVLADSLILEIDEGTGEGWQQWTVVDDFYASSADDRHVMLNRTTGEIRFGDGKNGRIPASNVSNPGASIIARTYRFGGGRPGNVAAGKIATLMTGITGIDQSGVANLRAAAGGRDEETLDAAIDRAPRSLKSKCRAVTSEDFETLAMQAGNVSRAKALPLRHPDFPGIDIPGTITVLVVPETDEPNPLPGEATLRNVCAYLNERRLLTSELYVGKPEYRRIEVDCRLVVADGHDPAEVLEAVENALDGYFHPLSGGEDGAGWPFGGSVYFSMVYRQVLSVAGVGRVDRLLLSVDGESVPECTDIDLEPNELAYADGHTVEEALTEHV